MLNRFHFIGDTKRHERILTKTTKNKTTPYNTQIHKNQHIKQKQNLYRLVLIKLST